MSPKFDRIQSIEDKFEKIFEFASEHPEFDTEFVDSVYEYFEREGDISDKQFNALNRICDKWGIDE